jgi:tetratricopeptide (TPR) repeat protein
VNEHRAFVAHVGLTLAVVWAARLGLGAAFERMGVGPRLRAGLVSALCLLILGGHAVAVHVRNQVYRTQESFWRDVTEKSPGNPRGWMNWAIELLKRERFEPGEAALRRSLALDPGNPDVHVNLGVLLAGLRGDAAGAELHFRRALELSGGDRPAPYDFYARFLIDQGRIAEALPLLTRSLQIAPGGERARRTLAELQASGAIRLAP